MGGISTLLLPVIFGTMFIVFILYIIYIIINYILESIFIYKNNEKKVNSFIPIYNKVILGKIIKKEKLGKKIMIIDILLLIVIIYSFIPIRTSKELDDIVNIILIIILVINFILNTILSNEILKKITQKFYKILTALNIITLGITRPIFLFVLKNNKNLKS